MSAPMVGIADAARTWRVSERTLRRRLSQRLVDGAERDDLGQWLIPAEWLDAEFARNEIDLRDAAVADGLAAMLATFSETTGSVVDAEVRAARAEVTVESKTSQIDRLEHDLQVSRAERHELERELSTARVELAAEVERRRHLEADALELRQLEQARRDDVERRLAQLQHEVETSQELLSALRLVASRRTRRKLRRRLAQGE